MSVYAVSLPLSHCLATATSKVTLSADIDIPVVRDNLTHYAGGSHCNSRTPMQGYAMPLLHSVSV